MSNELLVAKILRRYESDVPAVKQHLRDGEDRMLVEALRSAQAAVSRRPILSDEAVLALDDAADALWERLLPLMQAGEPDVYQRKVEALALLRAAFSAWSGGSNG